MTLAIRPSTLAVMIMLLVLSGSSALAEIIRGSSPTAAVGLFLYLAWAPWEETMQQPYQIKEQAYPGISEWTERRSAGDGGQRFHRPAPPTIETPPVVSLIGRTPLVPLTQVTKQLSADVTLTVKLEGLNPGGSVKDRAALFIVREALRSGELAPGRTLLDATSGNTGIAYAMLGAALGFPVHLALPADASPERVQILRAYGARLTLTDPAAGTEGARQFVRELVAHEPERYFHADQYDNPANPLAHYSTTGPEIWRDLDGELDFFVAGVGTGGTVTGAGGYLKERRQGIRIVAVEPEDSPVLSGGKPGPHRIEGIGAGFVPAILRRDLVDEVIRVGNDVSGAVSRRLAREEGLLVGISAGANVRAALEVAGRPENEGKLIVTILCDTGERYLSTWLYESENETP